MNPSKSGEVKCSYRLFNLRSKHPALRLAVEQCACLLAVALQLRPVPAFVVLLAPGWAILLLQSFFVHIHAPNRVGCTIRRHYTE